MPVWWRMRHKRLKSESHNMLILTLAVMPLPIPSDFIPTLFSSKFKPSQRGFEADLALVFYFGRNG